MLPRQSSGRRAPPGPGRRRAGWTPLFDPATPQFGPPLANPPFPDHPAGQGCVSGAIVHVLQDFFGTDRVAFSAVSSRTRTTRSFDRLSHALKEVIDARVWGGIHFRTADVHGAVLGRKVAHWLGTHYFQPTSQHLVRGPAASHAFGGGVLVEDSPERFC